MGRRIYDADGNLQSANLVTYLVPSAAELPSYELERTESRSPTNPLGVKGIGDAGTIGAAPAVINAVVDALTPLGVTDVPMPASPVNVWTAIQAARSGGDVEGDTSGAAAAESESATRWRTDEASPHDGTGQGNQGGGS